MASFNRVILLGNLTRDVELKYTANQTAVTDVGLAVNDRRKTATGEWIDEPTFLDVTLWGRTAEIASQYLSKGSPVLIEGRLKLDTWESEGQKRSKLRVVGERMQLLGRPIQRAADRRSTVVRRPIFPNRRTDHEPSPRSDRPMMTFRSEPETTRSEQVTIPRSYDHQPPMPRMILCAGNGRHMPGHRLRRSCTLTSSTQNKLSG